MKVKFLNTAMILTVILGLIAPAIAELTVEESTKSDALIKGGYSEAMAESVDRSKCRANRVEYKEKWQAEDPTAVRWTKKFLEYFDPAVDSHSFMNHDIKTAPSIDDL